MEEKNASSAKAQGKSGPIKHFAPLWAGAY